jgi:cell division control protein 24
LASITDQIKVRGRRRIALSHQISYPLSGLWTLSVEYKDREVESFSVRYRNEEQLKLWETTLNKMTMNNKSSVPNTHLMSMPLTPGYSGAGGPSTSHISYFDDEDDDDDDDYDDFEGDDYQQARSRSNSISAQLHHARSKAGLSEGPNNRTSPHMHATSTSGMTLAPLPRTSSSLIDHGFYPASPPSSKPSSPTTPRILTSSSSSTSTSSSSVHTPSNSNKTSPLWQRQSHEDGYDLNAPKGRSFSQSAATSYYSSVPPQQQAMTPRIRSQSSPNIHKNGPHQWDDLPQVPINSRTYYQQQQMDTIKIKLSYNSGIYVIVCSLAISFMDLMDKVEKKIKLVSNLQPHDVLRLKYQDEDEDFITVNSDDDVQMAFESRGGSSTVNLFVSL